MPIDPYAALHALLRAEAVRNAPPTPDAPTTAASQSDDEDPEKNGGGAEQNGR
ncbi:hypothetical protein [Streptomyces sp. NPDC051218]|uniref:hypothetical protein n=1 Tax=Streptomyces sp. NPDC051218 TaxID=3365645 RepID=UPI0037B7EA36